MSYSNEFLTDIYQKLMETRMLETRLVELYAEGRIPGHIHSGVGQEASYVGVLANKGEGDWIRPSHRPPSTVVIAGTPLKEFWAEILAKKTGNAGGKGGILHVGDYDHHILGMSGILGSDAGVAVGAALTQKLKKTNDIVVYFVGDGASNRGPVAEAMALASCWEVPVLFCCENNGFAISTPFEFSYRTPHALADKAEGYAMPSKTVDGTDVLAVYETAKEMFDYVRSTGKPAVLEMRDYRFRGHFEGDQCAYRDQDVTAQKMTEEDGVKNFEEKLLAAGVLTQEEMDARKAAFAEKLEAIIAEAEAAPEPTPEDIYENLYV
ncbi:pyruvate dehydrogenase E1 component alpha subunit [Eubacterium pyruvativorans]|uniref:Pyruvate dehydrogenase E1 component alpha subunit n=1 Tax=Eubacterium pyruvativorans TaxID=155865 RepID=A0A1I7GP05_9FIRM|nr:thiamine pyrophosphate-dependent dehydrogenase E1 component subunit alpha [Eubacterium pyruvativorans]SFO11911.1 pyruvate dehydrogenase E1 component alpha subunit [Eubacterium pyruvativorans]SFU50081.1 pyruvate dehydrogenase E1 component alpha subunit [Eubacterium pyruvativorans]HAT82347.1 thiamine pyrophosphate-dependent dehydrogenase E1 component subunit alpha [Eubacterium sp.]